MNNFERTSEQTKTPEQKRYSLTVHLEKAAEADINDGIIELSNELESNIFYPPNKESVIYFGVKSNSSGASFNSEANRQDGNLKELSIDLYGGSNSARIISPFEGSSPVLTTYRFDSEVGLFTEQTVSDVEPRIIESARLLVTLAEANPESQTLQRLMNMQIDETDLADVIERAMSEIAELNLSKKQPGAKKARQIRYNQTSLEDSGDVLPSDVSCGLTVTEEVQDGHQNRLYNLAIEQPYDGDVDTRKTINYSMKRLQGSQRQPQPVCTSLLINGQLSEQSGQQALYTKPDKAHYELLHAMYILKPSAESSVDLL